MSGYNESTLLLDLLGQDYDNFDEPTPLSNLPSTIKGCTLTFLILSWLFVTFRLYVRVRVVRSTGLDDLFVFLYLLCGTIGSSAFLLSLNFGTGQHMLLLTVGQVGRYLVTFYILNGNLNLAAMFIKLSLLFQYLRLLQRGTWIHRVTIMTIVLVSLWGFAFSFLAFVPCSNVSDFWYAPPDAHCWGYGSNEPHIFTGTFIAHTSLNMFFDMIILIIPLNLYWQAGITRKTRISLACLLLIGAFVNFLSMWRLQSIIQHQAGYYPTHDPTWYGPISLLLGVLEIQVASICASIPIFWPVLEPYLGSIFVTREINVRVQHERYGDQEYIIGDDFGFKSPGRGSISRESSQGPRGTHVRGESQTELTSLGKSASHYQNEYVLGHVDPLRSNGNGAALTSVIRSESRSGHDRGWFKEWMPKS